MSDKTTLVRVRGTFTDSLVTEICQRCSRQHWTRTVTCCHTLTWCKLAFLRLLPFLISFGITVTPFLSFFIDDTFDYVSETSMCSRTKIFLFQWNFISCTERAEEIDLSVVFKLFLGAFAKFQKVAIGFVVFDRPHRQTQFPLHGFS
jgi:hypothetical protein